MKMKLLLLFFAALTMGSCASKKDIEYFQNIDALGEGSKSAYEPQIQPDDLLMIIVSAADPKAAMPFNLSIVGVTGADDIERANAQQRFQTYLVDNKGYIQFPLMGPVKLGGLTRSEALAKLNTELSKYIKDPIVNMRIANYKVSLMGEVARPGSFTIQTERITLPEAISMAGDMTIYGNRSEILVIRESDGTKTYNFVDITKADFIKSEFYYLKQNDLVYVKPNKTRVNSSVIGPNLTVGISAISLLITIISLATR